MGLHAVLGGDGAIGDATMKALSARGIEARRLARKDADARVADQLVSALDGAAYVYHCVGLPYRSDTWRVGFPAISRALTEACEKVGAKLVYFDNAYLYGPPPLPTPFTEAAPRRPSSKKGAARKVALEIVMQAHRDRGVPVVVGRAADFYGPGAVNSPFYISFLESMLKGKPPQVAMPQGPVHTYAYTLDIGRALVELALDDAACGEEFHLPVGPAVTVADMAALFNAELGTRLKVSHIPDIGLRTLSIFNPLIRDVYEMSYQYKSDYIMSDQKFRARYPDFASTSYEVGVAAMVAHFRSE